MPLWARLICIGLGALTMFGIIYVVIEGRQRASAARHWPTTQATVLATDLIRSEHSESNSSTSSRRSTGSHTTVSWEPVVIFSYTVASRPYRSKTLWLNDGASFSSEAEGSVFLSDYPVGKKFQTYYNPSNPADAASIIDAPPLWVLLFSLIGAIFVALGIFLPSNLSSDRLSVRHT
jgi:Protein of unknown function (DUF3592)